MCAAIASTGHAAALRVEESVDQMQVARPATARADRELAGERGVGGRGEGGGLLVTHVLPRRFRRSARIASVNPLRLSPGRP